MPPALVGIVVFAILGLAFGTAPRWLVPLIAARSRKCLYAVRTAERVVALTFDDGPDPSHTPAILDVLRAHDAHATFFLISSSVPGNEALVSAIVECGHEIGNHMTCDEPSARMSPSAFEAELNAAGTVLARFGPVRWCRPASGWYNKRMVASIERAGYRLALGSVYPYDAHVPSSRMASAYILANARPGAVVILHEGAARGARTVATLQRVLPVLRSRGYRFVTLSELVGERLAWSI